MRIRNFLSGTVLLLAIVACTLQASAQSPADTLLPVTASRPDHSAGFQLIPKLGLGMSRNFLVDLGLIGYSYIPNKNKAQYYDANISVMLLAGKHTMLLPKIDLQAGLFPLDKDELVCFNLGFDAGLLTDFSQSTVQLTPKAGFSVATGLVRIYYLHSFLLGDKALFPGYGRHGVLLEVNISVLQGRGFKTM